MQIDRAPRDVSQICAERERILDEKPAGQLALLLDSAWRELGGN
jgi:hypothetical protein